MFSYSFTFFKYRKRNQVKIVYRKTKLICEKGNVRIFIFLFFMNFFCDKWTNNEGGFMNLIFFLVCLCKMGTSLRKSIGKYSGQILFPPGF